MGEINNRRRGLAGVGLAVIVAAILASCANQPGQPAPVFNRTNSPMAGDIPPPPREMRKITIQPGQSLSVLSQTYHVPEKAIIAANHLTPPYALKAGATLLIPDAGPPAVQQAVGPTAAPSVAPPTPLPPPPGTAPPPRSGSPPPASTTAQPDIVPLDTPPPQTAAAPPSQTPAPPPTMPPSNPPPAAQPSATPSGVPPVLPPRNPAAALPLPGEQPPVPGEAAPTGRFPWPVNGRVLATFGSGPGGGHNDGINIAAPRGAPVRSIEAGTVAYAGNEVKGYGNLILIKHPDGWISAYAHLDEILVKVGDNVTGGQIIAKVGNSGGVSEPQLHFELRRGKKPVDPREFLAPSPGAA
jgi:murein DD-endopeptidase MepM/ murein hydrolase activator NlpD